MCDRITDSWAEKYGYSSAKEFEENAQKKFSLIETGVMDQPNTRLLLLNVSGFPCRCMVTFLDTDIDSSGRRRRCCAYRGLADPFQPRWSQGRSFLRGSGAHGVPA